ncbi:MAG: DNA polymerase III subunit delta [Gemmatimonadaceae bacterium]|nr:DNA polymerase III subunit delta [Gemmatimonadaceae bacterium]
MSSPATQKVLKAAVTGGQFAPAYYLFGDDDYLKEEALTQLVDAALGDALRDFNLEMCRGGELDAGTIGSLLGTPPMMADRRVIVVRDAGSLKKDARQALDRYLASPAPDTVVLLTSPAGAKADKTLGDRATPLAFEPLSGDRIPKWIVYHAKSVHGVSITEGAVDLLQGGVGSDLPLLAIELDKCASFTGGAEIDEDAVSAVVGIRRGETVGAFIDAISARDTGEALRLLPGILEQPKVNAVTIVLALSAQFFGLAWAQAVIARGGNTGTIMRDGFAFLKEGAGFTGRPWGEMPKSWTAHVKQWSATDLDAALAALLAADRGLKDSRVSSDEQWMATLVLTLCGAGAAGGRRTAAATSHQ